MADRKVNVLVVSGVEGPSLYVDNVRVAGPKPWGGGQTMAEWDISLADAREFSDLLMAPVIEADIAPSDVGGGD